MRRKINNDLPGGIYYEEIVDQPVRRYSNRRSYYNKPKKSRTGLYIFLAVIFIILFTAIVTNPSQTQSKQLVKETVLSYVDDYIQKQSAQSNDFLVQAGAALGMTLAPSLWDYGVKTKVDNYVLFSKFSSDLNIMGMNTNVVSGIILFGQVIPLNSGLRDLKKSLRSK